MPRAPRYHLYLVRTRTGALYTGIALDVPRRLAQHAGEAGGGARALRGKGPLVLAYTRALGDKPLALRAEHAVKRLTRTAKLALVAAQPTRAALLRRLGLHPPTVRRRGR
jgi:putative endonuclease